MRKASSKESSAASSMASDKNSSSNSWYAQQGENDDIVISTRVRLARNLANFPFPEKLLGNDGLRVKALVFDAFNKFPDADKYSAISLDKLDENSRSILKDRGVIEDAAGNDAGIAMRADGKISCTINICDHVRISSFASGLEFDKAYSLCRSVDDELQKSIQFAASYDFGYLTSSIFDAGSGMKISFRLHLPALSSSGKITELTSNLYKQSLQFTGCYGAGGLDNVSAGGGTGSSLGSFYQVSTFNSFTGSEVEQAAGIVSAVKQIVEMERKASEECIVSKKTSIENDIYRSFALSHFSKLLSFREAVDIISNLKWGLNLKMLSGIDSSMLHSMLYKIQDSHLQYIIKSEKLNFEKDIEEQETKKISRLRAMIIQEAFEKIKFND